LQLWKAPPSRLQRKIEPGCEEENLNLALRLPRLMLADLIVVLGGFSESTATPFGVVASSMKLWLAPVPSRLARPMVSAR
jgi:hypothetical protein